MNVSNGYSQVSPIDQPNNVARPGMAQGTSSGMSPFALIGMLRRRWGTIVLSIVITVAAAIAFLSLVPPTYKATSVVLVDPREQRVTRSQEVLSNIGQDAAAVESQVELITSNEVITRMIARFKLESDPEFTGTSLIGKIVGLLRGPSPEVDAERMKSKLVATFRNKMHVQRRGLTYVIEINFHSKDPVKAARIANAIAETYLKDQSGTRVNATVDASNWLTARIKTLGDAVKKSEGAVAAYKAKHNIVDVGTNGSGDTLYRRQIENINQQLIEARARTVETGAQLDQISRVINSNADPGSVSTALNSQVITRLRVAYADLVRAQSEASLTYGSRHPRLAAINRQISDMRQQIDLELRRIFDGARNEHQIAENRVNSLTTSLKEMQTEAARQNQLKIRLGVLEREADANRRLYEQFLERQKETKAQQSLLRPDARIVSPALVPVKPNRPGTLVILAVAIAAGLAIGCVLALVLETLAAALATQDKSRKSNTADAISSVTISRVASTEPSGAPEAVTVQANMPPASAAPKPMPKLNGKVVMVTSTRTTPAANNVAAHMAEKLSSQGKQTLLINLDASDVKLASLYTVKRDVGLAELLAGKASLTDAIAHDAKTGLYVLGAGPTASSPGKLAGQTGVSELLAKLAAIFDTIILDAPTLGRPGGLSPELSQAIDSVVQVSEPANGPAGRQAQLSDLLKDKIIGTVRDSRSDQPDRHAA